MTPFNVAALRTAAELLQMTKTDDDEEGLREITEAYFGQVVTMNREYVLIVFRSCLNLLPEVETTAFLVSRCIEALSLTDEGYNIVNVFDDVVTLRAEDFEIVAQSLSLRLREHDVLYEIVDLYLKVGHDSFTNLRLFYCFYIIFSNLLDAMEINLFPFKYLTI